MKFLLLLSFLFVFISCSSDENAGESIFINDVSVYEQRDQEVFANDVPKGDNAAKTTWDYVIKISKNVKLADEVSANNNTWSLVEHIK